MKQLFTYFILFLVSTVSYAQVWSNKTDLPGTARRNSKGFSINGKGYLCQGGVSSSVGTTHFNDLYEYDASSDSWSSKTNFPGTARRGGVAFTVGSFAYVGLGWDNSTTYQDLYQYDPSRDQWGAVASYPGLAGRECFAASDSNMAFVGGGLIGTTGGNRAFWQFIPDSNLWVQRADLPFSGRANGASFMSKGKVYLGLGNNGLSAFNDWWQFQPDSNLWVQKASFPGIARMSPVFFEIDDKLIVGGGTGVSSSTTYDDYYEYDPISDSWTFLGNFPVANYSRGAYFTLNGKGYIAGGYSQGANQKQTLEFTPQVITSTNNIIEEKPVISIYPNPSYGQITMSNEDKNLGSNTLFCFDSNGKLVASVLVTKHHQQIDLSHLKSGIYFISYNSTSQRLIINK